MPVSWMTKNLLFSSFLFFFYFFFYIPEQRLQTTYLLSLVLNFFIRHAWSVLMHVMFCFPTVNGLSTWWIALVSIQGFQAMYDLQQVQVNSADLHFTTRHVKPNGHTWVVLALKIQNCSTFFNNMRGLLQCSMLRTWTWSKNFHVC